MGNERIYCDKNKPGEKLLILASTSEYDSGKWREYEQIHRIKHIGSIAYKLALLAAGRAQVTFSLGEKNEWDIAAGVLLVTEAGGIVTNKNSRAIDFQS